MKAKRKDLERKRKRKPNFSNADVWKMQNAKWQGEDTKLRNFTEIQESRKTVSVTENSKWIFSGHCLRRRFFHSLSMSEGFFSFTLWVVLQMMKRVRQNSVSYDGEHHEEGKYCETERFSNDGASWRTAVWRLNTAGLEYNKYPGLSGYSSL